jgi:hypothetical protein
VESSSPRPCSTNLEKRSYQYFLFTLSIYLAYITDMIYVFRVINQDLYKIGYTSRQNVKDRLATIQTGCPYILGIYSSVKISNSPTIDVEMEQRLHNVLSHYRVSGEWFELPIDVANRLKVVLNSLERLTTLPEEQLHDYLLTACGIKELTFKLDEILF